MTRPARSSPSIFLISAAVLALSGCARTVAGQAAHARTNGDTGKPHVGEKALDARLDKVAERLDVLAEDALRFWLQHGPDREYGGFHATLDRAGRAIEPRDKGIIQQTRHLFAFSAWYSRREASPRIRAVADDLFRFVSSKLLDPADGEYFYKVSRSGEPRDQKKLLYAQSFAIFGLAEYARAFDSEPARALALRCFRSIDGRSHDATYLGYDQTQDPGWFSPGTQKETNTHIHLLESFTSLYRATGDPLVRARLEELVRVLATRVVQPEGYARKEFRRDFTPLGPAIVSYGHDIETAWLLLDALDALGMSQDVTLVGRAIRLGAYSARAGFDAAHGGYFEEGPPGGAVSKTEKIWWIQAEALTGLLRLFQRTHDVLYLERLEATLSFIEQHQRDAEHGEWYWGVLAGGGVGPRGSNKGEEWKASYHNVRALLFTSDWIRAGLGARSGGS